MTETHLRGPTAPALDYYIQNVALAAPRANLHHVELDDSRPDASDLPEDDGFCEAAASPAALVAMSVKAVEFGAAAGSAAAGAVAHGAAVPLAAAGAISTALEAGCEIVHANRRGEVDAMRYAYDRMRGVLAALEGRADSASVRAEASRNREFAAGLRLAATNTTADLRIARDLVRRTRDEAFATVQRGLDRGPEFEGRYHGDLAFKHAVDEARALRARPPSGT